MEPWRWRTDRRQQQKKMPSKGENQGKDNRSSQSDRSTRFSDQRGKRGGGLGVGGWTAGLKMISREMQHFWKHRTQRSRTMTNTSSKDEWSHACTHTLSISLSEQSYPALEGHEWVTWLEELKDTEFASQQHKERRRQVLLEVGGQSLILLFTWIMTMKSILFYSGQPTNGTCHHFPITSRGRSQNLLTDDC